MCFPGCSNLLLLYYWYFKPFSQEDFALLNTWDGNAALFANVLRSKPIFLHKFCSQLWMDLFELNNKFQCVIGEDNSSNNIKAS